METSVAKRAPLPPTAYHTLLMADGSDTRAARHNRTYNVGTYVGGPAERCGHIGGEASPVTALGPRLTVHGGRPRHDGRARTQSTDGLQRPISPRNLPWISAPPRRRGGGGSGGGGGDDDDDDGGDDDDGDHDGDDDDDAAAEADDDDGDDGDDGGDGDDDDDEDDEAEEEDEED